MCGERAPRWDRSARRSGSAHEVARPEPSPTRADVQVGFVAGAVLADRAVAREQAERARVGLEAAGASVAGVRIGDGNPRLAVRDVFLGHPYDAVIVSTFPLKKSRWLRADLVERLERAVDVPITHVVAHSRG